MERLPAYARRAWVRARDWALPDMARGIASLGVALLVALVAYLAAGETGLIVGLVVGLAQMSVLFGGAFAVFLVGVIRHPERDKHWQPRSSVTGPHTLHLELRRIDHSSQHVYGDRCTLSHPNGGSFTAADDGADWANGFWFRYGGGNSDFPPDAPVPVSGSYAITWELRLRPDGPWQPIVQERDVRITMPEGES